MSRFFAVCMLALALAPPLRAQVPDEPTPFPPTGYVPPPPTLIAPPTPPVNVKPPTYQVYPQQTFTNDDGPLVDFTTAESFHRHAVWGGVDYTLWWFRKAPLAVPLAVTTTSAPGPGANILGLDPNARVILGPQQVEQDPRNGGRIWLGFWFDTVRCFGVEVVGMWIESPTERTGIQSNANGLPLYSRPIIMPGGGPGVYDISYQGAVRGNLFIQNQQLLQGIEANFVGFAFGNHRVAVDLLAGGRFLNLEEQTSLAYQVTNLVPMPAFGGALLPPGTTVGAIDSYRANNQFYGGQIGTRIEGNFGRLSLALAGKVAFGVNDMTLQVDGLTTRGDAPISYPAGVLANAANIGRYRESHYAYVPEGSLSVGWWFTPNLRLKLGYNILYMSDVIRPGSHISNNVNPSAVPVDQIYGSTPITRTSPQFQRTDFWAEGITFGIDFRY